MLFHPSVKPKGMASTSDSDDPNAKGNDEIDKVGAELSVNSDVKTTLPDTTE